MESRVEEISPVLVELKITVPWKTVEQGLDDAYKTLQKRAKVRGFRPGKVPRDVVKKLMGASVKQEVSSTLVQQGLGNAVREHSLDPVAVPEISDAVITDGQPLEFSAKVEVRPKIESVDTSKLEVKREKVLVMRRCSMRTTSMPVFRSLPSRTSRVRSAAVSTSAEGCARIAATSSLRRARRSSERRISVAEV